MQVNLGIQKLLNKPLDLVAPRRTESTRLASEEEQSAPTERETVIHTHIEVWAYLKLSGCYEYAGAGYCFSTKSDKHICPEAIIHVVPSKMENKHAKHNDNNEHHHYSENKD